MPNHRHPLRVAAAALTAVAGLVAPMLLTTLPAQAASALQYGKVVFVDDGDTIDVDLQGDGTSRPVRVRFIGIQAMEQTSYRAAERTARDARRGIWGGACRAPAPDAPAASAPPTMVATMSHRLGTPLLPAKPCA